MKLYKEGNLKTIIHLWEKEVRNQWSQFPFKEAKKNKINLKEREWKGIVMIKRIKASWEDLFCRVSWFMIILLQSRSVLLVQGEANRPMWSRVQKHVMNVVRTTVTLRAEGKGRSFQLMLLGQLSINMEKNDRGSLILIFNKLKCMF